jgi:hypothetical protein
MHDDAPDAALVAGLVDQRVEIRAELMNRVGRRRERDQRARFRAADEEQRSRDGSSRLATPHIRDG